jgi:hypothetical protein
MLIIAVIPSFLVKLGALTTVLARADMKAM